MSKKNKKASSFEDMSSYSSTKEYKKRRKNRRGKTILKSIAAVVSVFFVIIGAVLIYLSTDILSGLSTISISKDRGVLGINSQANSDNSIKNIALFGLDTRSSSFSGNSDSIIIVSIDNKHNKIKMTSILRDTKIPDIDGLGREKINAAFGHGGAELAIKTLNQSFNLNIEDFVAVNFVNMAKIVDAFGGTEVEITEEEADEINVNLEMLIAEKADVKVLEEDYIHTSGLVNLNGNQAVAFGRIRQIGNDTSRADRQKKVLMGLLKNLENQSATAYPSLIKQIIPMCQTSLDSADTIELLPILFKDFKIETLNIPGEEEEAWDGIDDDGQWSYIYDLDRAANHIDRFIYEESAKQANSSNSELVESVGG